ncbi:MAG: response regulator [Treponema sp.]|jgi:putative two-component system response regulator|nr:response regulator [Treponema sp.]
MKKNFVVDDNSINLTTAEEALSQQYQVYSLKSAEFMFEYLKSVIPDLILLNIQMPDIDGFEALKRLKNSTQYAKIPVIFLASKNDPAAEALSFEMGVIDFITKPFSAPLLLNRIKTHLNVEDIIRRRTNKLVKQQNNLINVLANMIENRDKLTGRHIERTTECMKILLNAMFERGVHADQIKEWETDITPSLPGFHDVNDMSTLFEAAVSSSRLHDIGKIAIKDFILNKSESLTDDEYEMMKTHALEGERIIDSITPESGGGIFFQNAKLFAGSHHEKWDGTGYPRGLSGTNIPLQGRVMAIVDVYDALVSDRSCKKAFTHEKTVEIIREGKGTYFDPQLVDVFLEIHNKFPEAELMCQ